LGTVLVEEVKLDVAGPRLVLVVELVEVEVTEGAVLQASSDTPIRKR
jgi:hypothetical protein